MAVIRFILHRAYHKYLLLLLHYAYISSWFPFLLAQLNLPYCTDCYAALRQNIFLDVLHCIWLKAQWYMIKKNYNHVIEVNVCSNCRPQRKPRVLLGRDMSIILIYPQAMPEHYTGKKAPGVRLRKSQHKSVIKT